MRLISTSPSCFLFPCSSSHPNHAGQMFAHFPLRAQLPMAAASLAGPSLGLQRALHYPLGTETFS